MHQLVEQDLALELSAWFPRIGRALHRCVTCSGGLMHSKELSRDSRIDALCLSLTLSLRSLLPPPPLSRSLYLSIYLPISLSLSPFALSLRCTVAPSWQGCVTKVFRSHRSTTYGAGCLLRPTLPALMIIVFSVLAGPRSQLQCACRKNPSLEGCPFKECPSSTPARTA